MPPCPQCDGDGCRACDFTGYDIAYTETDRAYDRQAFAADYGLGQ